MADLRSGAKRGNVVEREGVDEGNSNQRTENIPNMGPENIVDLGDDSDPDFSVDEEPNSTAENDVECDEADVEVPISPVSNRGNRLVFKLGIEAYGEDDAYNKYNAYAFSRGFGIRKSNKLYGNGNGLLRVHKFVCANQGKKRQKPSRGVYKARKVDARIGCKASAHFKVLENGVYVLFRFYDDHNHPFVPEGSRHQIRSHRQITKPSMTLLEGLSKAGVGPTNSYKFTTQLAGGYASVGFTAKDCMNYIHSERMSHFKAGNCQAMLDHFNLRQSQDPMFYYAIQCDHHNRMTNVFWRDGSAAQNYDHFGDVFIFDTTFRTNRYDMVCAPFVGVNNHWSNVYFGCAFLLVEKKEAFIWLFKCFRESMNEVAPKTIYTDQDASIAAGIKHVFPESQHRLCIWHIEQNARLNIGRFYSMPSFKSTFLKLLYEVEDPEEFEATWSKMIADYNLEENTWLQKTYNSRHAWAPSHGRDIFRANIQSSQRSESANSVFKKLTNKTRTLTQFLEQYETHIEYLREQERKHNYDCFRGKPSITLSDVGIVEHAAKVYTHAVFYRFQDEVLDSFAEEVVGRVSEEYGTLFILSRGESPRKHFVKVNFDRTSICCSCKLFETAGYLCKHAAKVMGELRWKKIPENLILGHWTRDVRFSQSLSIPPASSALCKKSRGGIQALHKLMRTCFAVMNLCAENEATVKMAEEVLVKLDNDCKTYRSQNNIFAEYEVNEQDISAVNVRDPYTRSRKKGMPKRKFKAKQTRTSYSKRSKTTNASDVVGNEGDCNLSNVSEPNTSHNPLLFPLYTRNQQMCYGQLGFSPQQAFITNIPSTETAEQGHLTFTQLLRQTNLGSNVSAYNGVESSSVVGDEGEEESSDDDE